MLPREGEVSGPEPILSNLKPCGSGPEYQLLGTMNHETGLSGSLQLFRVRRVRPREGQELAKSHSGYRQGSPEPQLVVSPHCACFRQPPHFTGAYSAQWAPNSQERPHQNWELCRFPAPAPELAGTGKAILMLSQYWGALASPRPIPTQAVVTCHLLTQAAPPPSDGGVSPAPPPDPGLTFCHSDSREARDEQAATNQQLPTWPWCRSWELMPSTKRRGSSHMSCGEAERRPHCLLEIRMPPLASWGPGSASPSPASPRAAQKALLPSPG